MIKGLVKRLADIKYVHCAIAERADLSGLPGKPTPRIIAGIAVMAFSYIIGWPAVGGLGILSLHLHQPLILAIGGPLVYGLSHLVFILGAYLAGAVYVRVFFRWLTRIGVEKLLAWFPVTISGSEAACSSEETKSSR